MKWLDGHQIDTRKLYTYYLPELLNTFKQAKSVLGKKSDAFSAKERERAEALVSKATQTVVAIVDELASRLTNSQLDKMECNTEVMESMAKNDGYVSDFGAKKNEFER